MVAVSIIIPVYNVEKYLSECLESVFNQSFKDFEVICVDDGSNDSSVDILKKYQKEHCELTILSQNHQGAGAARNYGFKNAKGKYVQFLDSDDYFDSDLIEKLYFNAEKYGAEITVCSSRKVDDEGNIIESGNPNNPINLAKTPINKVFNRNDFKEDIFSLLTPMPWNKLFLREFLVKNSIEFPNIRIYEDVAFVHSSVIMADKIVAIKDELISYRYKRDGSLANCRSKYAADVVKSCNFLKQFMIKNGLDETYKSAYNKAVGNHIQSEISFCNDKDYLKFLEDLKQIEGWENFKFALKPDYVTPQYLSGIIGSRKVLLWGASSFIKNVLESEETKNPNILGLVDRNTSSWGKMCGGYEIYPPEKIAELNPDGIILTVFSNNKEIYDSLKIELSEKFPEVKLFPNIFEGELNG